MLNIVFFLENLTVYEAMWKSIVQPDRPQMTIWHMRTACYITKSTNTHQYYVILGAWGSVVVKALRY